MVGWLLPNRAIGRGVGDGRDRLSERQLGMALERVTAFAEALAGPQHPMEAWSRYQAHCEARLPSRAAVDGADVDVAADGLHERRDWTDAHVDFPNADRRAFLLRRSLGNHAPVGLDFSILEKTKVGLALLRAQAPDAFEPAGEEPGDIDPALLHTLDAMVRNELRVRWERASLIRGREIPPVHKL